MPILTNWIQVAAFFLNQDIEKFLTTKFFFDDYIKTAELKPAFTVFEVFRERVEQRIEFALGRLDRPFDFSINEDYLLDRSDSQWAISASELDDVWRKRIKNDILNLRLADEDNEEIITTLKQRYTHIARRIWQFKSEDVFQSFTNAYVSNVDPHTSYFSPRASENFKINMRLSLEGIGAVLQTDNEHTLVRRIVPGGPADLAGELQPQDRIIGVGQEQDEIVDVIGWRLDDVVQLIRGPKSTTVRLQILPGETGLDGEPETIAIVRDQIKLEEQAAKKQILKIDTEIGKQNIGLLDLPSFYIDFDGQRSGDPNYRSTTRDVRALLKELKSENIDGLVIDLRGNGGGSLDEAIKLTGLFIRQGPVVQVETSSGDIQVNRDPDPEIVYDGPLAVLVDRYSASASEIFAGAIQDYHRGLIIGEPTFGKGTVQNLVSLDRYTKNQDKIGQLKVTIAQFFRVNGDSTQFRGVVPDLMWPIANLDSDIGERAYENAIPWRYIRKARYRPFQDSFNSLALTEARTQHLKRINKDPEFQFLVDATALNRERREIKTITLNEKKRWEDRQSRDNERLVIENKKRKGLGEKPFETISELDNDQKNRLDSDQDDNSTDAMVKEAAKILSDYLVLSNTKIVAAVKGDSHTEDPVSLNN